MKDITLTGYEEELILKLREEEKWNPEEALHLNRQLENLDAEYISLKKQIACNG